VIAGRELIAYHEAGHAAVIWLTGRGVVSVRIWRDGRGQWRGIVYYGYPTNALCVVLLDAEGCCPGLMQPAIGVDAAGGSVKTKSRLLT